MRTVQLTFRFAALNSTYRCVVRSYAEHKALVVQMTALGWRLTSTRTLR